MTASIPASAIVNVYPNVIAAGGTGLDLCGLFLTRTARVPLGGVQSFGSAAAVAAYFGFVSPEASFAATYFAGFDGSTIKPAKLLIGTYTAAGVSAYLRGGSVAGLTLAGLKALSGTLALTINGRAVSSGAINLASVSSFPAAAAAIEAALADADASFTGSINGNVLTASAVTGAIAVGQVVAGVGVAPGTTIVPGGAGTGSAGTYNVDTTQITSSTAMRSGTTTVFYDTVAAAFVVVAGTPGSAGSITAATGSIAAGLKLSTATGAVVSPGGDALAPGAAMDAFTAFTQDFVTFGTIYEAATDDKVAFGAWANGQNNRFLYLMGDSDVVATLSDASASAGGRIRAADYSGTMPIYDPVNPTALAAFVAGTIASIDFQAVNGRTNVTFRAQAGLNAGVTDRTVGDNLIASGYNFYGAYATANDRFVFLYPGQVTGPYLWADSFVDQVWLSNAFQLVLMVLLTNVKSIPYNNVGYAIIQQTLSGPVETALAFGAIRAGVPLSAGQVAEVNAAAGLDAATTLSQRGWYLQVQPASAETRAARGSPPVNFWFTDGQSVQKIALNSVQVQ